MITHRTQFDRLRIATPCSISWDTMKGDSRVRFCDLCELNVFNISELTRDEVEALLASKEGRICARLYRRADGTVLTKDCPVALRALRRRVTKRATAVLTAMLSLCSTLFSQQPSTSQQESCSTQQTRITRSKPPSDQNVPILSGTVLDRVGAAIANAKVLITDMRTRQTQSASANDDGAFQFPSLADGRYSITIEATNFKNHVVTDVVIEKDKLTKVDVILEVATATVMVIVGNLADEPSLMDTPMGTTIMSGAKLRRLPLN